MNLRNTQKIFAATLMQQSRPEDTQFRNIIRSNVRIPEELAVEIYRNNSTGALVNTLRSVYPVVEFIVGELCFGQMAADYVQAYPSTNPDLNMYGENFTEFIKDVVSNNDVFSELLYLYDLAKLEACVNSTYYANNDENKLARLNGDGAELLIKPVQSMSLMQSYYPVLAIWQAHKNNAHANEIEALQEIDYLVIYRKGYRAEIIRVDLGDWKLLTEIMKLKNLQALAEFSLAMGLDLDKRLPAMLERGWVVIA